VAIVLGVLCLLLAVVIVGFARDRGRLQRQLADAQHHIKQLESDLDAALRPPPPSNSADRAVRRVIRAAIATLRPK